MRYAVLIVAALATVSYVTSYDPRWLTVRWDAVDAVPFPISANIQIASGWRPLKRSSLRLVCSAEGAHLILQARLAAHEYLRLNTVSVYDSMTTIIFDKAPRKKGIFIREFEVRSMLSGLGVVDTIVTAPLEKKERAILLDWFERGAPQSVSFLTGEMGGELHMGATVDERAVAAFLRDCRIPT